jgi:hypothetical protein
MPNAAFDFKNSCWTTLPHGSARADRTNIRTSPIERMRLGPVSHPNIMSVSLHLESDSIAGKCTACRKILEQHGGRIWIEREFGRGETFCFRLRSGTQSQDG